MAEERICIGCERAFTLSDKEVKYYSRTIIDKVSGEEIHMVLPKRCNTCLAKKRAQHSQ